MPDSERCVVRLLDQYISKLPPHPFSFYLRPLDKVPSGDRPWYCKSRVRIHKLKTFMPNIAAELGLGVRYTNHSLRATAVMRMYNTGVPEKLIAEKSGHKSLKALRVYEHTLKVQEKSAGQCIQSGASFDPICSTEDKENSNPVPKISMPSAGPTSSCSSPGVPRGVQQFSGLTGCTFNFTSVNLTHFGAF